MTDSFNIATDRPIPPGTRVNVDPNFTHADGYPCLDAPRSVLGSCYVVHTPDDDGDYTLRFDGNPNCFHAAARFVTPYVAPTEDNTPAPAEPQRVSRKQALAFIGAGYVDPSVIPDMSAQRSIINGEMPADLVSALATLGEHGLRNMGGGR